MKNEDYPYLQKQLKMDKNDIINSKLMNTKERILSVDVLITNAWTKDIFRIVKRFNPKLVTPCHEIEVGHTVWDRLPFRDDYKYLELNYTELKKQNTRWRCWAESYHFELKK